MIENPQPAWLPVLLLPLPGIVFTAFALNQTIFPRDDRPLCTVPALAIVLALLPTHIAALALGDLSTGLAIAWGIVGASGYAWSICHWNDLRQSISLDPRAWRKLAVTALCTVPIVLPTILFNFFDEARYNQHHAIIAHLQNGAYPPRYLYEPTLPLRYHYAFDLAGAIVTGLLRVRVDQAVDLLTIGLWPCMFLLLWRVGEHVAGPRAGLPVALAVSFSAGFCPFFTVPICFYFQHPWSTGLPIFCLVLLQHAAIRRIDDPPPLPSPACGRGFGWGLAVLLCSLSLLSLCEVVLFLTAVAALAVTEICLFVRSRDRRAIGVICILAVALASTKIMGGFFASEAYPPSEGILKTAFYFRDYSSIDVGWRQSRQTLELFGLLIIPGIVGLWRARHAKLLLGVLAAIGLAVFTLFQYKYTEDIFKFPILASIALTIGVGVFLSDAWSWSNTIARKAVSVALAAMLLWKGIAFYLLLPIINPPEARSPFSVQMISPYFSTAYPVDADEARAVTYLRRNMGPTEILYRGPEKSEPYAIWGGIPTQASMFPAAHGTENDVYGLGAEKFTSRRNLEDISQSWFDRLAAAHVTWIAADGEDAAINALLDSPEGQHRTTLAAHYGNLRIFRTR